MLRKNNMTLKFAKLLYTFDSIEMAADKFSALAEIAIQKNKNYIEVSFANDKDSDIFSEFANYALFLTIQSR